MDRVHPQLHPNTLARSSRHFPVLILLPPRLLPPRCRRRVVTEMRVMPIIRRMQSPSTENTTTRPASVSSAGARGSARISAVCASGGSVGFIAARFAVLPVQCTAAVYCPYHMQCTSIHMLALFMYDVELCASWLLDHTMHGRVWYTYPHRRCYFRLRSLSAGDAGCRD